MSIRYSTYLAFSLAAGFIVLVTQAFDVTGARWITFAGGVGFAIVGSAMLARRGLAHRTINASISTLGVLMVIETLIASSGAMLALSLAGGLGVLVLALAGLTVHEISTERVVHSIEVAPAKPEVSHAYAA